LPLDAIRRLVVLPGSFNPPHVAHLALVSAAVDAVQADAGAFLLSVRTVDKERVTGMLLEDRLWLLCRLGDAPPDQDGRRAGPLDAGRAHAGTRATLISNRGLYVDMALGIRSAWPDIADLWFVVGYDKIVQIFDPRYYDDRDSALDLLFARARFLVAPRDAYTLRDVQDLLDRPENRRYAAGVQAMPLDSAFASVSSTAARELAAGHLTPARQDTSALLPELVRRFIADTGCYADDGRYDARAAQIAGEASRSAG
jgi:nicotinic acid mononucleotide adenylyltransferase